MAFLASMTAEEVARYSLLVQQVSTIRSHYDLLNWLQGSVQHYFPHEIMVAAWGDFDSGEVHLDIVSALPGVRTEHADPVRLMPLLKNLRDRWMALGCAPFALAASELELILNDRGLRCVLGEALQGMKSSLAHGVQDSRGKHDCLYVMFNTRPALDGSMRDAMEVLLPYLDIALRRLAVLPRKPNGGAPEPSVVCLAAGCDLSEREIEIMQWVKKGKTNQEIALILDISSFTVKNHLQRIFKKMEVSNRTHAVTKFDLVMLND